MKGTLKTERINKSEPVPSLEIPDPPDFLTELALAEWDRVVGDLFSLGLIAKIDMASLAAYCQSFGRWAEAETQLKVEGLTIITAKNNVIQNPLVGIANQAMEHMRKHLANFGMSPADRAKVSAKPKDNGVQDNGFTVCGQKRG